RPCRHPAQEGRRASSDGLHRLGAFRRRASGGGVIILPARSTGCRDRSRRIVGLHPGGEGVGEGFWKRRERRRRHLRRIGRELAGDDHRIGFHVVVFGKIETPCHPPPVFDEGRRDVVSE